MGAFRFPIKKSPVSEKIRDTQKFDTSVDRSLGNDEDCTFIFSKVIGNELSHSSSANLYLQYWVDFASNAVRTKAPHFVYLGLLTVNASNEVNIFGTPDTKTRRHTDGNHWYATDHVFGKATAVGMSATRSELDYSYETGFQNWRANQDFGRQNILMSRPPLDSTDIGTNMTNRKTSPIDLIPIGTKMPEPMP